MSWLSAPNNKQLFEIHHLVAKGYVPTKPEATELRDGSGWKSGLWFRKGEPVVGEVKKVDLGWSMSEQYAMEKAENATRVAKLFVKSTEKAKIAAETPQSKRKTP